MAQAQTLAESKMKKIIPDWPLVVWIIAAALVMGLASGMDAPQLIEVFNSGWGRALGEFALILIPSFVLASALARQNSGGASGVAVMASPFAGAGMICPDTAYAALSPLAGRRRLPVAFGSYAGFKLLFPAGPLIVATGLGVSSDMLLLYGLALFVPVWAAGVWWAGLHQSRVVDSEADQRGNGQRTSLLHALRPFAALAVLLVIGMASDLSAWPLLDFLTLPKGALLVAAAWALLSVPSDQRRDCLDTALRRTASLLLVIGAASAFGAVLTATVPIGDFIPAPEGIAGIVGLFLLTAAFKLAQGSSMATFAAVAPVAAPIVAASSLSPVAAVFAICLGSFVAILPNDSFYWLVRRDALTTESEGRVVSVLAGGAVLQAVVGLSALIILSLSGLAT